ncbi:MAG: cell division protein FtsL [Methylophilaceae bacterium]|jgi:cell division protein FtsL|nr:cell division protein FtsL [Methylophilaceae bacterium]
MTRLNFILFFALLACAMGLVTSQHKARKLFIELQQHKETAKSLDMEWSQLQLEQSTWAMHSRLEQVARDMLHMHVPETKHIQIVTIEKSLNEAK